MKCLDKRRVKIALAGVFCSLLITGCGVSPTNPFDALDAADKYHVGVQETSAQVSTFAEDLIVVGTEDISLDGIDESAFTSALLMCLDDEDTLYANEIFDQRFPASTTKLMTTYIILKNCDLDDTLTVSATALDIDAASSVAGLRVGDTITVRDCLYGLMVQSGNDAANALAEYYSGSSEAFVEEMNQTAAELGMTNTHYENTHGLHDEQHYTTVYDLYLILNANRQIEEFMTIVGTDYYQATYTNSSGETVSTTYESTDYYLTGEHEIPDGITILGGKTGTTNEAGACLALMSRSKSGKTYFSIVMGADTHESLYVAMDQLLEAEK